MATNNAINVPEGTTGQLLVGVTSAAPAFGSSASGDFTFTSATAGATRTLTVSNTDNTNSASTALVVTSTGGASAGDAFHQLSTTTTTWSVGVDNSVTSPTADPFVISQGTALGTNNIMSVATSGEINYPLQPAFLALLGSDVTDVTGDGTVFILGTGTALTEIFDQNSDFNTNGTFTSPVTGRYNLSFCTLVTGASAATNLLDLRLVTSNRTYVTQNCGASINNGGTAAGLFISVLSDMDAADTCTYTIIANGGTKTADIYGSTTVPGTFVSGALSC